jgi:hypothetical protein
VPASDRATAKQPTFITNEMRGMTISPWILLIVVY